MHDPTVEHAARLVVLDETGAVLLFRYDTDAGPCWATPGGRVEAGESFADAAAREACEELGIEASPTVPLFDELVDFIGRGPAARRWQQFFVIRVRRDQVVITGAVDEERRREGVLESRWWPRRELAGSAERIFPDDLADRLALAERTDLR